jgi:hypothetical protein
VFNFTPQLSQQGDGRRHVDPAAKVAAEFTATTPRLAAVGWFQKAVLRHGAGRVAVFGETAMFSAQVSGEERFPMGMNDPAASGNYQFLLNIMRWLSARLN